MVKTAVDVERLVREYVAALEGKIEVDRVILTGDYAWGKATDDSDVWLLVVSPTFDTMEWVERSDILALTALRVDLLIQAWGFAPAELADSQSGGKRYLPFLGMMLNESREVYTSPAVREDAGGLR